MNLSPIAEAIWGGRESADQTSAKGMLKDVANTGITQGKQYLQDFGSTMAAPRNYFQSLLSGNRSLTTAALAPDISRINAGVSEANQTANTLNARGGGRSATLFNLPFAGQSAVQGLFNQVRSQAASALPQIAGQYGQVGTNLLNTGLSGANAFNEDAFALRDQRQAALREAANNFMKSLKAAQGGQGGGQE